MKNRIRELRRSRGLTLEEVARRANTTNQQVHRLETGQRRLTTEWMDRIGAALADIGRCVSLLKSWRDLPAVGAPPPEAQEG